MWLWEWMHKIGCDIGCHLHDLTYLMMQLKASSPNLMVHQQCFVQLFLCARYTTKLQTTCIHAHKIYEIYTLPKRWTTKTKKLFGSGCFKGWRNGKTFWQPWKAWNERIFSHCSFPPKFRTQSLVKIVTIVSRFFTPKSGSLNNPHSNHHNYLLFLQNSNPDFKSPLFKRGPTRNVHSTLKETPKIHITTI